MARIWFHKNFSIDKLHELNNNTMARHLGFEWHQAGDDFLTGSLPVDERTIQPYGLLHGGASCVLAETLGSVASAMVIDDAKFICVGLEINANHIRSARKGRVTGKAKPIHLGKSTHVWDIKIHDDAQNLICVSRLTVAILPKK